MNNFEKIVSLTDGPVQYEMTGTGNIKMVQHPYPYSEALHEHLFNKIGKRVEIKVPHPAGENLGIVWNL